MLKFYEDSVSALFFFNTQYFVGNSTSWNSQSLAMKEIASLRNDSNPNFLRSYLERYQVLETARLV